MGLDIELKVKIWNFFTELSQVNGTTILISTHDMNEAKKANVVGYLWNGKIVLENSPHFLMENFEVDTLDDVFRIFLEKDIFSCDE